MKHQTVQPSIDKHRGTVSQQTNIKKAIQSECTVSQGLFIRFFCGHSYAQSDTVNL